jgi:hypothetical protein
MADGRHAFLDFGAVRRIATERVDEAVVALAAFLADDAVALGASLERLAGCPPRSGPRRWSRAATSSPATSTGPLRSTRARSWLPASRARSHAEALWPLAQVTSVPPEDLWPLRMLGR